MVVLGADFVDPAVVDARVMVIAHRRKAAVANFALSWVFDFGLHHDILPHAVSICKPLYL